MLDVINECEIQTKNGTVSTYIIIKLLLTEDGNGSELSNAYFQSHLGQSTRKRSKDFVQKLKQNEKQQGSKIRITQKYPTNFLWQVNN